MNTAVEYAFHGLPRNVDVDLTKGRRSKSAEMLQNCSENPVWIPAVFLKAISRAMNPLPLTPSEKR
ncbi:hypothetical protein L195_g051024 [Trifolium pratense]|uniref:Uncharacterized protein n=1 Tax=Trifolium pratense TaxID=57577 RepID=A0A2K3JXB4_TRIPR|nr:hypothetical protein L195_g051024 [Trifolium pratense]